LVQNKEAFFKASSFDHRDLERLLMKE